VDYSPAAINMREGLAKAGLRYVDKPEDI